MKAESPKGVRVTKVCEACGGSYTTIPSRAERSHYCSKVCFNNAISVDMGATKACECGCGELILARDAQYRKKHYKGGHQRRKPRVEKKCACGCGEPILDFDTPESRFIHGHNWRGQQRPTRLKPEKANCACGCGEIIDSIRRKTDGRPYRVIFQVGHMRRGEQNHFWKGGITKLNEAIRMMPKYRQWRIEVYKRDRYTCVWCTSKMQIEADHIKSFALILEENAITSLDQARACAELWNVGNGRTLCHDCHKQTDTYAGKSHRVKQGNSTAVLPELL